MSYGLPYMGSKNFYAKQLCSILPSGKRLVDLFAGGCAVTDCAIREYNNKWETFLINDINPEPLDLYAKCLCGKNPVSYEWVTREEFKRADFATKLCWSFGNNLDKYIFGKDIEPMKHDLEEWLVSGTVLDLSGIFDGVELPELSSRQERMTWWKAHKKELPSINVRANRLEQIGRLEGCSWRTLHVFHGWNVWNFLIFRMSNMSIVMAMLFTVTFHIVTPIVCSTKQTKTGLITMLFGNGQNHVRSMCM